MSDNDAAFSTSLGWANGSRANRYAMIVDHGKITYAEKDVPKSIAASSAETVLAKL
jgi:alkyl hydroperoxide reductase 1